MRQKFNSIESVIADVQAGKMVIVVDDADRENEGDLILGAEFVTIPGAGHSLACETPEAFVNVLLTFWVGYRS